MASKLQCKLCGRNEVWGLLSSQRWGRQNGEYCACPRCMDENPDWRERIAHTVGD